MSSRRIGEVLREFVPLSLHDIDEILAEQSASNSRKSFGDIALSMGLCRPEHVWKAWSSQLIDGPPRTIDLDRVGIDTQALAYIPSTIARELCVVPVRLLGDSLIVAISEGNIAQAAIELPSRVPMNLRFVLASAVSIKRALVKHYPRV